MPHIGEDSFSGEVSTEEGKTSGREDHKESSFSKSKKLKDKRSGRKNSKKKADDPEAVSAATEMPAEPPS